MNGVVALKNRQALITGERDKSGSNPWLDILIVTIFCAVVLTAAVGIVDRAKPVSVTPAEPLILIDPGHGGADGGAVAPDGTQEKEINLAISLPLADMLRVMGYQVSLTRTTDDMVGGVGSTMRERKVNDTKNRLAQAEQAAITVSIHQNSYPEEYVHGAQVFYYNGSSGGEQLAGLIQTQLVQDLDPENHRQIKPNDSYYLLKKTKGTIVIVECGFLSNAAEAGKLCDEAYQDRVAWSIHKGILQYINGIQRD